METADLLNIDQNVMTWLAQAREVIYDALSHKLNIDQKTSRLDLVTNVDKQVERLLAQKIMALMPNANILGEETHDQHIKTLVGPVWFLDPIDGTMNFIQQHDDFAIMLALYFDGQPLLGWIMDVDKNIVYHGGPQLGVWRNAEKLPVPHDKALNEGLIELSGGRLLANQMHFKQIGKTSLGVRIIGSAGISFIKVLEGKAVGYVSKMHPWDFAAAKVLLESLKIPFTTIDGKEIDMLLSNTVLTATATAHRQIVQMQLP